VRRGWAVVVAVAVSCSGEPAPQPLPPPQPRGPVVCPAPGMGLEGYVLVRRSDRRYHDHLGGWMEFRGPSGRRIFFLLGVPGEVGEGLPFVGSRRLVDGSVGRFMGEEDRWALAWRGDPPCEDMAVVGNEISGAAFKRTLRNAAILW
jgi:hypothetical protein